MAQPSTTYKFELNLTDLDRSVYESVKQTIARHPSETEERMTVRLLAYALWYNEQLSFGRGLSDVDEPALWEKSLDDRVLHWIEVGQPDADRLTWCSRRTERTSLLAYGSLRVWETKVIPAIKNLKNVNIAAVPQEVLETLAKDMPRVIKWDVMISEGTIFVTDDPVSTKSSCNGCKVSAAKVATPPIFPTNQREASVTPCVSNLANCLPHCLFSVICRHC
ncbi:Uncharacterized conserved protein YaeQ, suppresses RfaH defect [Pseudomonas moraviensis]|nr:Uncharacterized conserved protein YaeQ, suppresses RfaH defect [Pseudomonas moraviensis]